MYALMSTYKLGRENRSVAEKAADQTYVAFRDIKGFVSVMYLADDAAGEYTSLGVWESKELAEAALAAIAPQASQFMAGSIKEPPVRRFLDVYEPKP